MVENFERIPTQEQQRILQACIQEFAQHGYTQASTNAIVKVAGIPKGTLFFFFGNKKNLYLYVIDYAVKRYVETFDQAAEELPTELFERLLRRGRMRMQFALAEPLIYQLFFNAFLHTPDEIKAELESRYAGYAAASASRLYAGLDRSRFRDGVDIEKAVELTNLLLEGVFSRYAPLLRQSQPEGALLLVEQLTGQVREYFELLKFGLYK